MEWNTGDADFHYNKGVKYWEEDKIKEAIKEYKEAIRIKPNHVSAHYNLGLAYWKLGRTEEAIHRLKYAVELGYERARTVLDELSKKYKESKRWWKFW